MANMFKNIQTEYVFMVHMQIKSSNKIKDSKCLCPWFDHALNASIKWLMILWWMKEKNVNDLNKMSVSKNDEILIIKERILINLC